VAVLAACAAIAALAAPGAAARSPFAWRGIVEGAYGNMRHGYTDETWAKEHHGLWYNEVKSGSRAPAGGAAPAGAPHMKEKT